MKFLGKRTLLAMFTLLGTTLTLPYETAAQTMGRPGQQIESVSGDLDSPFMPIEINDLEITPDIEGEGEGIASPGLPTPVEYVAPESPEFSFPEAVAPEAVEPAPAESPAVPTTPDPEKKQQDYAQFMEWLEGQINLITPTSETTADDTGGLNYLEAAGIGDPIRINTLSRLKDCLESMRAEGQPPSALLERAEAIGLDREAVESIVFESGRPATSYCGGKLDLSVGFDFWPQLATPQKQAQLTEWGSAIGLVEAGVKGTSSVTKLGTAFHIGNGLVLTAGHVLTGGGAPPGNKLLPNALVTRDPSGAWALKSTLNMFVNFTDGNDNCLENQVQRVRVTQLVALVHTASMDAALLQLDKTQFAQVQPVATLKLRKAAPVNTYSEDVITLGYPLQDRYGSPSGSVANIFGKLGAKRVAPGVIRTPAAAAKVKRVCLDVLDKNAKYLYHDCSVLAGNSGSAVLALDTGDVVALHFNGFPFKQWEACNNNGKGHPGNKAYPISLLYADPVLGPKLPH